MADVTFDKATRIYPGTDQARRGPARPRHRGRRVPRPRRPLGLRQVHLAAHARRPGGGQPAARSASATATSPTCRPKDRDIAMVFQNYALYPHMTVADNMGFALKIAGVNKAEIRPAGRGGRQDPGPRALPRPQAQGALRRPAPARRHGPRDRAQAAGLPHGRAAVEPGRQAPGRRPAPRSPRCSAASASPPSTSPTTRSRP